MQCGRINQLTNFYRKQPTSLGFNPQPCIVLMLFGLNPSTLQVGNLLSDPPPVTNGATVMVFQVRHPALVPPVPGGVAPGYGGAPPPSWSGHQATPPLPQSPKFLSNFKLAKFDGNSRHWKAWNKSFIRYLAIHQLDYVLES
jgi:hypothetical protein